MRVHFEDEDFDFDLEEIDVAQARKLYRQTGLTLAQFEDGIQEANPEALVACYWLMKAQNGVAVDMGKVNFKIVRFGQALGDAAKREKEERDAREAANPTGEAAKEAPETT